MIIVIGNDVHVYHRTRHLLNKTSLLGMIWLENTFLTIFFKDEKHHIHLMPSIIHNSISNTLIFMILAVNRILIQLQYLRILGV